MFQRTAIAILALLSIVSVPHRARSDELFPFVLPWDDDSAGVTDLSGWLHRPAGKFGPIRVGSDGHLYAGQQRQRFFGVNVCFDACFPRLDEADKVAARLAKFGVNIVRFHHMDMSTFPGGLRARAARDSGSLEPAALERLDHFIYCLKRRGIYTNLNLLVSRPFNQADGLPAGIESIGWKERHAVGFFHAPAQRLQEAFARKLLTHRNPHTSLSYAEDPAVAFVEINNENGLIHAWLGQEIDRLPEVFRAELRLRWNAWLRQTYGTDEKLLTAWDMAPRDLGNELLTNGAFARGTDRWVLEKHGQAEASAMVVKDGPTTGKHARKSEAVRIAVTRPGTEGWHVQFNQPGLRVAAGQPFTCTFWGRADRPTKVSINLGQAHAPWRNLGLDSELELSNEWRPFRFVVRPEGADDNARVSFTNLAHQPATIWLAEVSLRPGDATRLPSAERLEGGGLSLFDRRTFKERSAQAQRDWIRFLWETEDAYWQSMQRFLREELKVRGLLMGTIVGCSTPNLMARFDVVDTHAYWEHPHFPGRQWDPDNWVVRNKTMVNAAGGTLPGLAQKRIIGKPHSVSEYNHAAPNTYGSEGFLLLAAYGALQDWDAIYAFAYSHRGNWATRRFASFFDVDQHPTKMATFPAAAALFLRGDVRAAAKLVSLPLSKEREVDLLRSSGAWRLVDAGHVGLTPEVALIHRVGLEVAEGGSPAKMVTARPASSSLASDTGELLWDRSVADRGVVQLNSPRSKAVIGYGGGRRFDLGGVVVAPGQGLQDGWSAVTLTLMKGERFAGPGNVVVTTTGLAENTGMKWKSPARESVGRSWGQAPARVEGVPVQITLPWPAKRVGAWALDERGQRRLVLPVLAEADGRAALTLGPPTQTLWYELELR